MGQTEAMEEDLCGLHHIALATTCAASALPLGMDHPLLLAQANTTPSHPHKDGASLLYFCCINYSYITLISIQTFLIFPILKNFPLSLLPLTATTPFLCFLEEAEYSRLVYACCLLFLFSPLSLSFSL